MQSLSVNSASLALKVPSASSSSVKKSISSGLITPIPVQVITPVPVFDRNSVVPFEKLKVTTFTFVVSLTSSLNISTLFWFLPLTKFSATETEIKNALAAKNNAKGKKKKIKLPHGEPRSIMSARYEGFPRGTLKIFTSFKNSITTDISVKDKNLSVKLTKDKIHITGAKTIEQGKEATEYFLDIIYDLISKINLPTGENGKKSLKILADKIKNNIPELQENSELEYLKNPDEIFDLVKNEISCLNDTIYNWLNIETVDNIHCFADTLALINPDNFSFCSPDLKVSSFDTVMVNYNYKLGFTVNRANLKKYMDKSKGLIPRFDNAAEHSVTIECEYTKVNNNLRKKTKKSHHTFIVYKSGIVTQSGPGGKCMEDIYYTFMEVIGNIKDKIIMN